MVPRVMYRRVSELTASNPFWPRSAYGYQRTLRSCRRYVCFALNSGSSRANVRFRTDLVRFNPNYGRSGQGRGMSGSDPLQTFTVSFRAPNGSLRNTSLHSPFRALAS